MNNNRYMRTHSGGGGENCLCDSQPVSYAMAYVKNQNFGNLYPSEDALYHGTLFRDLELPFCKGGRRR